MSIIDGLYHIKTNIQDVASSIAKTDTYKRLIPGKDDFVKELGENFKNSMTFKTFQAQDAARSVLAEHIPDVKARDRIVSSIRGNDISGSMEKVEEALNKHFEGTNVDTNTILNNMKKEAEREAARKVSTEEAYRSMHIADKIIRSPGAYFNPADKATRNTRIGAAAVGYGGVAVAGRYLQGGTLTRDSYGRRDIAGVPFI